MKTVRTSQQILEKLLGIRQKGKTIKKCTFRDINGDKDYCKYNKRPTCDKICMNCNKFTI